MAEPICSFCDTPVNLVRHLIKGGEKAYICDDCVISCVEVINSQQKAPQTKKTKLKALEKILTPEEIVKHLNEYIIGQDRAKRLLALALYNHYKRINRQNVSDSDVELQKSNIMLMGPSGSGKTYLVSQLAKLFDVPYAVADATTLTEAGYVGDDVDQIIAKLLLAANGDVEKAQRGICYIDEVDKITRQDSGSRDVRGEGVQQALLKMIEGGIVSVNPTGGKKNPNTNTTDVDTTNILFIFGGAFSGLTDKQNAKKTVGFHQVEKHIQRDISHKELIRYGMIPEFMGRIPVIAELNALTVPDLVKILKEPKNSVVAQYKELFRMDGCEAIFSDDFLEEVAKRAHSTNTGARGLRSIMETALADLMFEIPSKKIRKIVLDKSVFDKTNKEIESV